MFRTSTGMTPHRYLLKRRIDHARSLLKRWDISIIEVVKAWLYTILRNIRLNQIRQRRIRPKLVELDAHENAADLVIDSARDPHSRYVNKLEKQQVRVALHQLSEEYREIIVLREYADLSYQGKSAIQTRNPAFCHTDTRRTPSRITRSRVQISAPRPFYVFCFPSPRDHCFLATAL
jgi:DNA-directed RNA polymerase specialized sigma24 family protein